MAKLTELERDRAQALRVAFDSGYATRFVKGIILSETSAQIDQWLHSARDAEEYETGKSVRQKLKKEGIRIPSIRCTAGQNFID